jgi:hypothetical protein
LAKYTRIFLPNQIYIKTNHNRFMQSFTINPIIWQNDKSFKKNFSHFYMQTSFIIERKVKNNEEQLNLNPFDSSEESILGLIKTFTNSLSYNRGKRDHSATYSYSKNETQNILSIGNIQNTISFHLLQYEHLVQKSWLLNLQVKTLNITTESKSFAEKNYTIEGYLWTPKISYLYSKNISLDLFYEYSTKENKIGSLDNLKQNRFGTSFSFIGNSKFNANGEISLYENEFDGNEFSSAGYQMLEGLQKGKNTTWRTLFQTNLTKFLDLNFIYQGRKSETSKAIHNGSVELRAYF